MPDTTKRFRLTIAYDGTAYAGWQVQPGDPTVQETIESVLRSLVGEEQEVKLHGSGRTDQGVHARGQVAHFDLHKRLPPDALKRLTKLVGDFEFSAALSELESIRRKLSLESAA